MSGQASRDREPVNAPEGSAERFRGGAGRDEPNASMSGAMRFAAMLLLVLVSSCIGGAVVHGVAQIMRPEPPPPERVVEVRATPSVVTAVRDLARLETTSFHIERVIDMSSRERRLFGLIQSEDTILLVAAADVVAGIDLARLREEDVVVRDGHVTITAPEPEIFTTALDNERTYVHRRDTDLLARRSVDLETRARREAERTLRDAAIEAGIERRARQGAQRAIESLVRSLGYEEVTVRFRAHLDVRGVGDEPDR